MQTASIVNVPKFVLGQSVTTQSYPGATKREARILTMYSTWFPGCLTAAAKPATHINYIAEYRDGTGCFNGAGHFLQSIH